MPSTIQLFEFTGVVIGIMLLILLWHTKKRIKKGPLGTFFSLYSHKYLFSVEFGILFLTASLLISVIAGLENFLTYRVILNLIGRFLLVLAMAIFAFSGKIFLQEVERMLRHREKKKEIFEKMIVKNQKQPSNQNNSLL